MENTVKEKQKEIIFVKYSKEELENWTIQLQPDIDYEELMSLYETDDEVFRDFYLYLSLHFMYAHITQQVFL